MQKRSSFKKSAVITISDKAHAKEREDVSGKTVIEIAEKHGFEVVHHIVLPDEQLIIQGELERFCALGEVCLILTTGGTGFSPRDVTPEATLAVVEKLCPGIPEAMRAHSMQYTPRAMLSRAVAGIRGNTLIVNLPGSPKAVRECLEHCLLPIVHGLEILTGTAGECAR